MTTHKDALPIEIDIQLDPTWLVDWLNEIVDDRRVIQIRFNHNRSDVVRTMTTENPKGFTRQEFLDCMIKTILRERNGRPDDHIFFEGAEMADDDIWIIQLGS